MKYKNKYNESYKQNAYMNACDCLYYGYGYSYFNGCGCLENEKLEIWEQAKKDLS